MKLFIKNNIKFIIVIVICLVGSSITTLATNYIFNSNEVSYDNTESGLHADEVQGAIDEVFQHATDYSEVKNTIGTGSLTTTSNTLIGGVNELNSKIANQTYSFTLHEYTGANNVSVKRRSGDLTISGWIQITNTLAKSEWLLTITNPPTTICNYYFRLYELNTDYPAYLTTHGYIEVDAQVPAGYYNFGITVPIE